MSRKGTVAGEWINGKNKIECSLPLIEFEDGKSVIAYCPALDLSGYGSTAEEAEISFKVTLSEYFRYTLDKGTLATDLKKLGWQIKKTLTNKPVPPTMENLLTANEDFSRIFNTYDFRKRNTVIQMPVIA